MSVARIAVASGLLDPDSLAVGDVLTIPRQEGWLYRVEAGDTLDQIAASYGVRPVDVQAANFLEVGAAVRQGEVLLIPDIWSAGVVQPSK